MGKKYFSEEDVLKMKEAEKGGGGDGPGCSAFSLIFGLGLIIAGLFWASAMQGKTLTPVVTPFAIGMETAVSQLATPTLAPTATATASATAAPTETATAIPTHTPLPTQTPYPTYTPYPSATWTAQPTFTPQATWTPEPTHTAQPTYTPYPTATATDEPTAAPVATDAPFADLPGGDGPLPGWLIGAVIALLFALIGLVAYVAHQMRPVPPTPILITPEGIPVDTAPHGRKLPPPGGEPVRETRPAPVQAPVTPVTPPGAPEVAPVQTGQGAPPETIAVSVTDANPDTDEATMTALCAAWNEIAARGEQPSLNKLCIEYFGGKNSERMAIARRAVRWGRANNLIGTNKKEVKQDDPTISDPKPAPAATRRGPILVNRHGRSVLN